MTTVDWPAFARYLSSEPRSPRGVGSNAMEDFSVLTTRALAPGVAEAEMKEQIASANK